MSPVFSTLGALTLFFSFLSCLLRSANGLMETSLPDGGLVAGFSYSISTLPYINKGMFFVVLRLCVGQTT
jgi:hypothetical protein